MEVTLHIPGVVVQRLFASGCDLSRRALETYKAGRSTEAQRWRLLGFQTRDALWLNYTMEDLERECAALRRLGCQSISRMRVE